MKLNVSEALSSVKVFTNRREN